MSTCRSCGAAIKWATSAKNGRRIPLDPAPVPDGNLELYEDPTTHRLMARHSPPSLLEGERYVTHFATCPNADRHRRR